MDPHIIHLTIREGETITMNSLIQSLYEDHRHFVGVLYHLEREVKALGGLLYSKPNFDAILDIFDYIKVYPQVWHHPIEDIIYEKLLSKDVPNPGAIADLMEEHGILDMLTDYIHDLVNRMSQGADIPAIRLVRKTNEFIQRQLKHINQEQCTFFPLVEQCFDDDDWEDVQRRLEGQVNAAGEVRWQEYKSLYKSIVGSSAVTAH